MSRLLFDDQNSLHYGSFGDQDMNANADPLETQREAEALQRVVARTSKYVAAVTEAPALVDIHTCNIMAATWSIFSRLCPKDR